MAFDVAMAVRAGQKVLMTKREAAAFCGLGISTFDRYRSCGFVPQPIKIGSVLRWRVDQLREWVEAGCPRG